ncbi:MAG TPA: pyridoxamine 5'-phosphate oxidase family protein [Acidimicrobiales bacterium]|nr:pyridoxamine 5'-phosphate oxidase family protein [Acidimicrobiales bacterium]
MASWDDFVGAAPELAALSAERLEGPGLCLVGTLRRNGWPRISPVEPLVAHGRLYLGMMWQSKKALDLLADPRCVVHRVVTDAAGTEGDVKLYGRAAAVTDPGERERYAVALEARIGWRPEGEEWHLFALDLTEVGYVAVVEGGRDVCHWRPQPG